MQYCLQHWTWLSPQDTATVECCFRFGSASSFFLEILVIALCSSPIAYWTPSNLGDSSSSVMCFCSFILLMGFSRQEYWRVLPFPPPVGHILSVHFTMTRPSWVALHSMAYSFIALQSPFTKPCCDLWRGFWYRCVKQSSLVVKLKVRVHSVVSVCNPMDYTVEIHGILQARVL